MIVLDRVSKAFDIQGRRTFLLSEVSVAIPSDRKIALFFDTEREKRLLIDLLAGLTLPTTGRVVRHSQVSFPVGYTGGFQRELSVQINIDHMARLYGVDVKEIRSFITHASGLKPLLGKPFGDLEPVEKRKLAFVLAYCIPFDMYLLLDEPQKAPADFRPLVAEMFKLRSSKAGAIIPTRSVRFAENECNMAIILAHGRLKIFETVREAVEHFSSHVPRGRLMTQAPNW